MADIDPGQLSGLLATPRWLRQLGLTAWLLVGLTLLLVAAVWRIASFSISSLLVSVQLSVLSTWRIAQSANVARKVSSDARTSARARAGGGDGAEASRVPSSRCLHR